MSENILIIAPHPDDEVLGCGASIARFVAEGNNVYVLVATRGSNRLYDQQKVENVRDEAREAHRLLGVKDTVFLEFPAPELDTVPVADIARAFSKVIHQFSTTKLFLPHRGDIHNDHSVVFNAGLVAARPVNNCPVKQIYTYETLSETEWAAPYSGDAFVPNVYMDVSQFFEKKIEAFACFKSQLRSFPNPRSFDALTALASFRGSTVGLNKAEAFMCIRIVK